MWKDVNKIWLASLTFFLPYNPLYFLTLCNSAKGHISSLSHLWLQKYLFMQVFWKKVHDIDGFRACTLKAFGGFT